MDILSIRQDTPTVGHPAQASWPRRAMLPVLVLCGLVAAGSNTHGAAGKSPTIVADHLLEKFDGVKFSKPTDITNQWLPMKPGMRFIYDGTTVSADGKVLPHRIVLNITDLVKVIAGVPSLVSYDLDYSSGELEEAELAFFAQDDDGNVWRLGEYPEEYENGRFVAAPTWITGIEGARAGIMMKAQPHLGAPSYSQGYGPAVHWTDRGEVHQVGQEVVIAGIRYTDVLVTKETSLAEQGAWQLKYYARGVGNIAVGWLGEADKTKETLTLTRVEQMNQQELAAVRARAMALERSGYRRSPNVYGLTAPSTIRDPGQ